ncbi:SRPBCC domain-containing protein [Puia sp.]|jgi:PhnB protein|uniref:SRPBCC family protein n=1 Tax=Puia sp. TaxID=2045100 RepID=UPI002F41AB91
MTKREAVFSKDLANKKITVVREFDGPLDLVWKAWTDAGVLDEWWAPKPFKAVTKKMDFRAGGQWLYFMKGPDGNGQWCSVEFDSVQPQKNYSSLVAFCDEAGNKNMAFPVMSWRNEFSESNGVTTVRVEISFEKEADMQAIISMGFEEGFKMGLGNLDEYLQARVSA